MISASSLWVLYFLILIVTYIAAELLSKLRTIESLLIAALTAAVFVFVLTPSTQLKNSQDRITLGALQITAYLLSLILLIAVATTWRLSSSTDQKH